MAGLPTYPFGRRSLPEEPVAAGHGGDSAFIEVIAAYSRQDARSIDPAASIADLGIDSLLLMRMIDALETQYSIHLSLDDVLNCASIGQFAAMLAERVVEGGQKARQAPKKGKKPKELEVLQSRGSLAPAFWFHGSMGTVQAYIGLSQSLGRNLPFTACSPEASGTISSRSAIWARWRSTTPICCWPPDRTPGCHSSLADIRKAV
ncbi:hypothetical protein BI344_15620 [Chromobacterium sphagni]|uniref:Carrier domain-containing protein n=1 Tax=Chromobacterium sphagni TaxID=1903179 RepID=A0ABX3CD47_9NEIS|nr:acyl carrier protein [Chromobacterium sphagni]OHX20026.1 hypothetical protein BI344_15620 [Chromobacterium sphagni]